MAFVDDIINDMALTVDAQPVGQSASMLQVVRAVIGMGRRLHSDAAPESWYNTSNSGLRPDLSATYRNKGWWEKLQSWFVLKRTADSNRWANVELHLKEPELLAFRQSTGTWVLLGSGDFTWGDYYKPNLVEWIGPAPARNATGGGRIYTPSTDADKDNVHGGGPYFMVNGIASDIVCVHFRFKARLIKKDISGVDDIATAKLILTSGLDVYPNAWSSVGNLDFANANYVPSAGQCRYKYLSADWQTYAFTSVKPDYDPLPSRPLVDEITVATAAQRAVSETWLRANPPPDDGGDPAPSVATLRVPSSVQAGSVVRARFTNESGGPISGATVSWQGASGGVIYNATTNDQGVSVIRLTTYGSYTLTATDGTSTATASITATGSPVANFITASETPTSWARIGTGPTMTGGQVDIYGGTRWGLFTQGSPSGGDPSGVQVNIGSSMLTSGRISGEVFVKKGNQNWVALYVFGSTSGPHASARGWFNINDGSLGAVESLGVGTNAIGAIEPWGNGFYRISLSVEVTGGGGDSMMLLRVDTGNQAYAFPSGATVTLGGGMLHLGTVVPHLPTDLATAVSINPKALTTAFTGQPYGEMITCVGMPPITWSISSGSLPAGITADTGYQGTSLSLSATNVTAVSGTTFTVTATDGVTSDSESFTIPVGATAGDPSGLSGYVLNSDSVYLSWTLNGASATETVIEGRYNDGGWTSWIQVASVAPDATSGTAKGLVPGRSYEFRVFQRTVSGQTGYSNSAAIATKRLIVETVKVQGTARGVGSIRVAVWRQDDTGKIHGAPVYQGGGHAFSNTLVDGRAALQVDIPQDASQPLRHGDLVVLAIHDTVNNRWTQVIPDAVIGEI